jgi:hypothetical protein
MSHWHRSPRSISVGTMLLRAKLRFILDDGLPAQLLSCLPASAHTLRSLGLAQRPSREDLVALCHQNHEMLVTADPAYACLLILEGTRSELEWAAEYCQSRARAAWNPNHKERSEYWIRLRAQVADALAKAGTSSQ